MGFTLAGRTIQRIAVVGSGNIGPDVALFFSRNLARHGVPVILHDISQDALDAGRNRIDQKLRRGGAGGLFSPFEIDSIEKNIKVTLDPSFLTGCDLVLEAVNEDLALKQGVFERTERIVPSHAILASTSSHLEPERIFERVKRQDRTLVHHFFFPAERNPLIEIVAGQKSTTADWCCRFYESMGKVPIRVKGRYGYAVNPIFEGIFLAAMLIQEQGYSPAVIDAIACRALGASAGPFTVVNLAGGNLITRESLAAYHEKIMPWFQPPPALEETAGVELSWRTAGRGDTVSYSTRMYDEISSALLGAYFGLACEALESGIADLGDLEIGVELGLALKPPFGMMNDLGPRKVRGLVEGYAQANPGFRVPRDFGPWKIPVVVREDRDDVAVLTLRRPKTLNALTKDSFRQLDLHLVAIQDDPRIRGVVVTGFGTKAFTAGVDVSVLSSIPSPEDARASSSECNRILRRIETLGKPVVCALNGLSLGSGSELAYACTARIARKGLPMLFGQPEVRLGIIPGAGGTQRLPRLIDFSAAWRLLRTGGTLSGTESLHLGLISEELDGDVVARAVELARTLKPVTPPEPKVPAVLPEVDLKGLSRKVDEILRRTILEGARLPLDPALAVEARSFGEVYATRDHRIGLDNYLKTSLKQPANFIHS
ncbi:MAG TPA: 3-hydroxyacyl-CoA dehydrogenase NAD-binding domain-containing protein [Planctomycetota bacterium]|nr:3-hydroxyacyl-CoA dehydrogenase NAD-binding domain-containing protein [Planctomycetota bacterium]